MYGAIIIDYDEFQRNEIKDICTDGKDMKEKMTAVKVITGYRFDNSHFMISNIFGDLFAYMLSQVKITDKESQEIHAKYNSSESLKKHKYILSIWNSAGSTSIYTSNSWIQDYDKPIDREIYKKAKQYMEDYSQGIFRCSRCEVQIKNKRNRYFAGIYCDKCWNDDSKGMSLKEQERRETYD